MVAVCKEGQAVGEGLREILPALATLRSVDPEEKTVMRAGMVRVIRRINLPAGRKLRRLWKVNISTKVLMGTTDEILMNSSRINLMLLRAN